MQIKNTVRFPLILSEWLLSKRQEIAGVGENMEKREHMCTLGGNANQYSKH